jgi:DNA polymerase-3 subunit alpha
MPPLHFHAHLHTEFSLLDGVGRVTDLMERAKECGHERVAMTDHGSMRGVYRFHKAAKAAGIKPVYGCELYMTNDRRKRELPEEVKAQAKDIPAGQRREFTKQKEAELGISETWHLCAWAMNEVGLSNLFQMTSEGWYTGLKGNRPRVDWELLEKYNEGVLVGTACVSGIANKFLLSGEYKRAVRQLNRLLEIFGPDRVYGEVMPNEITGQDEANKQTLKWAKQFGFRPILTNDVHYLRPDDWYQQEVLMCLQFKQVLADRSRFRFDTHDFWFRSPKEMLQAVRDYHPWITKAQKFEMMANSVDLSERCNVDLKLDKFACILPDVDVPPGMTEKQYMIRLCKDGWQWRNVPERAKRLARRRNISHEAALKIYSDRLPMELRTIFGSNFERYFLIVHDLYKWVRKQEMTVGPGRGSAAGCLVSFLLGITSVDPIEHDLLFERFMSPGRIDMPDIDMDFEDVRRQEVIDYLMKKYGPENTSLIGTIGTLKGKQCLRDVSRVHQIPANRVAGVTGSIVERSSGDERASQTVEDSFKEFKVCQEFNKDYPHILPLVMSLEGQARQKGVHAAGVVISPSKLSAIVPMEVQKTDKGLTPCTAVDFWGTTDFGLLKLDVLGLRNLSVIGDCLSAVKERHGKVVDLEAMPMDDPKVFQSFTDRQFAGIFQYDTTSMFNLAEAITFDSFEGVAAMNALNRPGTSRSGLATKYIERKNGKAWSKTHPIYDEITKATYGIIVYQEQVIQIFKQIGGYEPSTADSLRKDIAKKAGVEVITKEKTTFMEGAAKHGMSDKKAGELFDSIVFFGSYGFNKSHAVAYAAIAYWEMWLKVYYPVEFMWALLKHEPDPETAARTIQEAERLGVEIIKPHINHSNKHFRIDEHGRIIFALNKIKWVTDKGIEKIVKERDAAGEFISFADFRKRVGKSYVNKRSVENLVKAGAFVGLIPNVKFFLEQIEDVLKACDKRDYDRVDRMLEQSASDEDYSPEMLTRMAIDVCPLPVDKHPVELYHELLDQFGDHIKFQPLDALDWDSGDAFIRGQIIDLRYNQVGDFHTTEPDQAEKDRIGWGKRYSNFNLQDETHIHWRIKLDIDKFDEFRPIIEKGVGTCVAMKVSLFAKSKTMQVQFMADLDEMERKMDEARAAGKPEYSTLNPFELYFIQDPLESHREAAIKVMVKEGYEAISIEESRRGRKLTKSEKLDMLEEWQKQGKLLVIANPCKRLAKAAFNSEKFIYGIITDCKKHEARNGIMAFLTLAGPKGGTVGSLLCFNDVYEPNQKHLTTGDIVIMSVLKQTSDRYPQSYVVQGVVPVGRAF